MATFGEYIERYCQSIFKLPGSRIDIIMDRYDVPSIKDQKRKVRAKNIRQDKKKGVKKAISEDVVLPQNDSFKSFLSVDENKMQLQQMIGDALIFHAPKDKCIIVSGAFASCTEVKCSSPGFNTEDLQSDHHEADTRLVVSIQNSSARHVIVDSKDTDAFIILVSNYEQFPHYCYQHKRCCNGTCGDRPDSKVFTPAPCFNRLRHK